MKRIKLYLEDCKFFGVNPISFKNYKWLFKTKQQYSETIYR